MKPLLQWAATGALVVAWTSGVRGQQVADDRFQAAVGVAAYPADRGPVVAIDEAHHNFHTAAGRYAPFARLLRADGYRVEASAVPFSTQALRGIDVLVIANALHPRNETDWTLPTPSAFTDDEIAAVRAWVDAGGALLLIADHMPMAGAATALGEAFGIRWNNGFAIEPAAEGAPLVFRRGDGSLGDHAITRGRLAAEGVASVATFTGSAFQAGDEAAPLLVLPATVVSLVPQEAWAFTADTPRVPVGGWLQGAALERGKGRVAVFGEAAMFSAQLAGPNRTPVGMNAPVASRNPQFLLNVLHWLSRAPDVSAGRADLSVRPKP